MLLDGGLESGNVGTDDLSDALAVLVDVEGGHGADANLGGDVGQLVDVDLVEGDVGVLLAELLDLGGDGLAGTAPGGEEVDHGDALAGLLGELRLAVVDGWLADSSLLTSPMPPGLGLIDTMAGPCATIRLSPKDSKQES